MDNLEFAHYFGQVSDPHVAAGVLLYLEQPRFLNPQAEFYEDVEFWRENLARCPSAFRFLPDRLRDNVELARMAIKHQPDMLKFGGPTVRGNNELARLAIKRDGLLLAYCSLELRGDIGLLRLACNQNLEAARSIVRDVLIHPDLLGLLSEVSMKHLDPAALQDADVLASCILAKKYDSDSMIRPVSMHVEHVLVDLYLGEIDPQLSGNDRHRHLVARFRRGAPEGMWNRHRHREHIVYGGPEGADAIQYQLRQYHP